MATFLSMLARGLQSRAEKKVLCSFSVKANSVLPADQGGALHAPEIIVSPGAKLSTANRPVAGAIVFGVTLAAPPLSKV